MTWSLTLLKLQCVIFTPQARHNNTGSANGIHLEAGLQACLNADIISQIFLFLQICLLPLVCGNETLKLQL